MADAHLEPAFREEHDVGMQQQRVRGPRAAEEPVQSVCLLTAVDLDLGAFDVDLGGSPLTNSLPIRRLDLLKAETGVAHRLSVAWILVPSLEVVQADQIYTPLGDHGIRYASETFSADLTVDDDGFVNEYPGLALRI